MTKKSKPSAADVYGTILADTQRTVASVDEDLQQAQRLVGFAQHALNRGDLGRAVGILYSVATLSRAAATRLEVARAARTAAYSVLDPGHDPTRPRELKGAADFGGDAPKPAGRVARRETVV